MFTAELISDQEALADPTGAVTVAAMGSRPGHGHWDDEYAEDVAPPWEIGEAQPAMAAMLDRIPIESPVLDAGCGTGELALLAAKQGHHVVGIDCSQRAITRARAKAADKDLEIDFRLADAERLRDLDLRPRTVLDCGLLHNLDDEGQRAYVAGLEAICAAGAMVCILAVSSDAGPGWPLTRERLSRLFPAPRWSDTTIEAADVLANVDGDELHLPALLLTTRRAS